jgi:PAS domain S-box-containing protein
VSVNKAFENLTGLKEVTGRKVSQVIPGIRESNPDLFEIYGRVAESGQPERFETRVEPLHRSYSVSVYSSKKGSFTAVFEDISERKAAEEALRASEEKYRGLFTNMTEGFALCEIITDPAGRPVDYRILEVNQAWEEQTGILGSEITGKPVKEVIPSLEQHWIDNYGEVALSGDPLHFENYNQFTDRWYEIYAYSPRKGQFVTMVQNITERKKGEDALMERELRFRTLIENLRSGVALIDEAGSFVTFNRSFLTMFGLSKDSTILNVNNQDWAAWQVYSADGVTLLPVDEHPVRQAALTEKPVRNTLVGVRLPSGGKLTWMTINAEPTLKPDGTLQYLIATYYDVTERKEAEEAIQRYSRELENHRNHLEELVKQRTEELQTLSHRLIMVQEEERRNLSRELHDQTGGSLTVLNLQLAKALRAPETMRSEVQDALKSVKELVTQVRTLSSTLHPGMLEDLGLVHTLAWYINDFSKKTGIEVRFEHSGMESKLAADMNINIYRMVQEALTNIARHAEVKAAKVSISMGNQLVKLAVQDAGAGFDMQAQSRGVGLRGMRERVLALKGEINVISAPGQGTRIEVTLPAVKAEET